MFSRFAVSAAIVSLLGVASAQSTALQVTSPSSSAWWVASSINTIAWTCQQTQFPSFTILIANSDPKVLVAPQAIIAIENNFDCSKTITQDQANQAAGTGYTIQLANPLNNTDVFATSEPFEIKPLGSPYPETSSAGPSSTGSGSAPAASQTGSSSSKSGASSLKTSLGGISAVAAAALGFIFA